MPPKTAAKTLQPVRGSPRRYSTGAGSAVHLQSNAVSNAELTSGDIHGPKEQRTKAQRTKGARTKAEIGVVERELLCHPRPDMGDLLPDRGAGPCHAEPRRPVSQTAREDQYV